MAKITDAAIRKALKDGTGGKPYVMKWDDGVTGLGLRIRASGSAAWLYRYRPTGAPRTSAPKTATLGGWPEIEVEEAQKLAKQLAASVASGGDPNASRKEERAKERRLLEPVIDSYVADLKRRKIVKSSQVESALRRGLASLMTTDIAQISRQDVVEACRALEDQKMPGAADYLRSCSRAFWEWAVNTGVLTHNVLAGWRRPKGSRAERLESTKGRALDDDELRKVWLAAGDFGSFGGLVRLGLLTALRRNELSELKHADVKSDRIVIGASRTKMGAVHEVPMTPAMRTVISSQPKTGDFVFGSSKKNGVPLSGWSKMLPMLIAAADVKKFSLHDLRRTARTLMSRYGVDDNMAELAVGHAPERLLRTYNKDERWAGRKAAFEAVSDHVAGLLQGSPLAAPVTPLKRKI